MKTKKRMKKIVLLLIIGILIALLATTLFNFNKIGNISGYLVLDLENRNNATELNSPSDRIKDEQIKVYKNLVIMHINNSELISITNTNSMEPLIDNGSSVIAVKPKENSINAGDIVAYESKLNKIILHRVVAAGEDSDGRYYIVKGDNIDNADPEKVRFNQIKGVAVGIIY